MHEDRILQLFTRKLFGTLTTIQQTEFDSLLAANPQMLPALKLLEKLWIDYEHIEAAQVEISLKKLLSQLDDHQTNTSFPNIENDNE